MIDIHCHVLPGLDDGSRDMPDAVAICRIAAQDGVRTMVATPHACDERWDARADAVREHTDAVNQVLRSKGIPLTIVPGMEVRIAPDVVDLIESGRVLTLNDGPYVLLEFHATQIPVGFENLVQNVSARGYGVVLAHPEKNIAVQDNVSYVQRLLERFHKWELLVQITADSLTGYAGPGAQKTARALLRQGLAHIIASDGHSPFRRPPLISDGLAAAAAIVGEERALQMVTDVPHAVLQGAGFPSSWGSPRPRRWWRTLFSATGIV